MTTEVLSGSGVSLCRPGFYALYENKNYNRDDGGKVLISNDPIVSLERHDFAWKTSSVVNYTESNLHIMGFRAGEFVVPSDYGNSDLAFIDRQGKESEHRLNENMDDFVVSTRLSY